MHTVKHATAEELPEKHKCKHPDYEHIRRDFVPRGYARSAQVSIYEVPPGKSAYPYHYHLQDEEVFFILSGVGLLRTPEGEREVKAGELLFFPAGSGGAHKLTNLSETEVLRYIDFDVIHELDVAVYPDSGKIGIWGMDTNKIYPIDGDVDYYQGE